MAERRCRGCGVPIKPHQRERNPKVWCSERCRVSSWRETDLSRSRRMATAAAKLRRSQRRLAEGTPIGYRSCVVCDRLFVVNLLAASRTRQVCSNTCRNRRNVTSPKGAEVRQRAKDRRRARMVDAFVEDVDRAEIYERDGWKCQLCRGRVDRALLGTADQMAPSLDHIVPLACGGKHEAANVQLAHKICNSRKAHFASADQLRLVG